MNTIMINPFASIPLDEIAIDIHTRYQIPGAFDYVGKDKDKTKDSRSRLGVGATNSNVIKD